jgi:hypothetical protein
MKGSLNGADVGAEPLEGLDFAPIVNPCTTAAIKIETAPV